MIRSVGRFAVEINKPDSPYFERVICFVRPQYAENGSIDLHKAARECIDELNERVEYCTETDETEEKEERILSEKLTALPRWALMAGAAALGSVMTAVGVLLII